MNEFPQWCATQTWTASVHEMLTKLWNKTEFHVVAYSHQGCHRTSNAVDRPMNRLCRLMNRMPRISQFYGIAVYMYYRDHAPPHFHAIYGDDEAIIDIASGAVLD